LASGIASLLSAVAYRRSAELATAVGTSELLKIDLPNQLKIARKHYQVSMKLTDAVVDQLKSPTNLNEVIFAANLEWDIALEFGEKHGFRNCQLTMLAPDEDFILDHVKTAETKPIDKIELMSAVQPFLTGGINLPIGEASEELCKLAWEKGLKSCH
jgi:ribonucleotide reductase alpha subunit